MRISKAVTPILEALGAPASKFAGKSLSKLITAVSPYAVDFINEAKGGGESNEFVVVYSVGSTFGCDKTYAEIIEALNSGKKIKAFIGSEAENLSRTYLTFCEFDSSNGGSFKYFYAIPSGDVIYLYTITHNNSNSITRVVKTIS